MENTSKLTPVSPDLAVFGSVPSDRDLAALARRGFRTVVDARLPRERMNDEHAAVELHDLRYEEIPCDPGDWTHDCFGHLARILNDPDARPIAIHCTTGARSAILALTAHVARSGLTVEELERRARAMNVILPDSATDFVRTTSDFYRSYRQP